MDGAGAIATTPQDFTAVSRWAQNKPSGHPTRDRTQFLEKFELFLARHGTVVQTRGTMIALFALLVAMDKAGLDIHQWSYPHAVGEMYKQEKARGHEKEKKPGAADDAADEEADDQQK